MEMGWLVKQSEEPESVMVAYRGQWCWLTAGGMVIRATQKEEQGRGRAQRLGQ
jgi:hypothetical protein